jgi:glycosyltransferase involved in cell wall biosynthesis
MNIPISVIVVTKNEEARIAACLEALEPFDEIIIVDSDSQDHTREIAAQMGARVESFKWNGQYPKKRQWVLENISIKHDFVFWVDADEIVTQPLIEELSIADFRAAGYFVRGQYIFENRPLKFGLQNNKLALMNRHKIEFPVVNDLDIPGMGEIEGHYQPVLKAEYKGEGIAQIHAPLLHDAYADERGWNARHERYAAWEREMDARKAWPEDVNGMRRLLKRSFKAMPCRGLIAFLHCYIWKRGFLDGARGFRFANSRRQYYRMI